MPANTEPIFTKAPDVQWAESVTAANATVDITTGTSYLVFTADATNGGYVDEIRVKLNTTTGTSAATVVRFWLNNGSTTSTAANSALIGELTVPATAHTIVAANTDHVYSLRKALPAGYKIYATLGTAPGGTFEFTITAFGGKY